MTTRSSRLMALPLVAAALLLVAGCGAGGGGSSGSASGSASSEHKAAAPAQAGTPAAAAGSGSGSSSGGGTLTQTEIRSTVVPDGRALIRSAALTVEVSDVPAAARRAEQLVVAAGGLVSAEETADDPARPSGSRSTLTLLVPPRSYSGLLDSLADLGTRVDQTQSTEDVTAKVVDVQARIAAQKASVARVQALLSRAKSLGEVVQVEGELTRRQADLESLESQQNALAAQVSLSTVELALRPKPTAHPLTAAGHLGFLDGLRGGWNAFVAVVLVALTVIGAVLPFAVVGGLLALIAWRVLARRRPQPGPALPPSTPGPEAA